MRTRPARYLIVTNTQGWASYREFAICGRCICDMWVEMKHSVDLDDLDSVRRCEEKEYDKFHRLLLEDVSRKSARFDFMWAGASVEAVELSDHIQDKEANTHCGRSDEDMDL